MRRVTVCPHLSRISGSERLEDSPRDTTEDLTSDEHTERVGENHDEDETGESDDGALHDDLGSVPVGSPSVELYESALMLIPVRSARTTHEQTENSSRGATVAQSGLPVGRNGVSDLGGWSGDTEPSQKVGYSVSE